MGPRRSTSNGISSSVNARARRCRSRSAGVRPYMGSPISSRLTDCSVYARLGGVTSGSPRTADAVVVGGGTVGAWCAWFLREAGLADVVLVERQTLGAGASPRAAGHGAGPGRHRGRGPAGPVQPRLLRRASASGSASTPASSRRATSCRASPSARWPTRAARIAMQQRLGLDVRWVDPDELDELNPAMATGHDDGRLVRARGRLHRPAPQRARLHGGAVHLRGAGARAHRLHRPAPRRDAGHRGRDVRRGDRHRAGRADRRPDPGRGGPGGRRTHPGRRGATPGRGHRAASRPGRRRGCRWSSTWRPASTGGPRRAACSGG